MKAEQRAACPPLRPVACAVSSGISGPLNQPSTVPATRSISDASLAEDYGGTDWMPACMIALRSDAELRKVDQEINRYFTGQFDKLLAAAGFIGSAARRRYDRVA